MRKREKGDDIMARRVKTMKAAKTTKTQFKENDIRSMVEKKAYELWQQRGGGIGSELDNWLEAERIVKGNR